MKIKKAVLPVAGMGTRFLPATKVIPKELLPIVDKPVIQYLVEELIESEIEEIIFVISEGKELIKDHFSHHPELEKRLKAKGKSDILNKIRPIHKMARFSYVYQHEPKGDGDAILCAEEMIGNESFVVLFGDDIVKHSVPATKQLLNHFKGEAIIAVEKVPLEMISSYGVVDPHLSNNRLHQLKGMVEKPTSKDAPSNLGIIGKYICPPEIFDAIRKSHSKVYDGEIRLIDGLIQLAKNQSVWAYEIEGERFDTGRAEGLIAANNAFLNINHKR